MLIQFTVFKFCVCVCVCVHACIIPQLSPVYSALQYVSVSQSCLFLTPFLPYTIRQGCNVPVKDKKISSNWNIQKPHTL